MNTNQLHQEVYGETARRSRIYPQAHGSIVSKNGNTKKLTQKEAKLLFEKVEKGEFLGEINVEIEFKTDAQGLKIAKRFNRLADNPAVKLSVTFKKIKNEQVKNK